MFKSVFSRLLAAMLFLLAAMAFALSISFSIYYRDRAYENKHIEHVRTAEAVNAGASRYLNEEITYDTFSEFLDSAGFLTDSRIYVLSIDKTALSDPRLSELAGGLDAEQLAQDLSKTLEGETVFRRKQFSGRLSVNVAFTAVPLVYGNEIKGAIILYAPAERIESEAREGIRGVWLISGILMLAGAGLSYMSAARITAPLKALEKAASEIAAGEAPADLPVKTNDETGRLTRTFNLMRKKLEEAERVRGDFIAGISHDLRSPLTSINGYLKAMTDGHIPQNEHFRYLGIVREETARLIRLTGALLELAALRSGAAELSKRTYPVKPLLEEAAAHARLSAGGKSINCIIECQDDLSVYADKDRLSQALYNIAGNSAKYGKQETEIILSATGDDKAVRFCIRDNGYGISEKDLPYIFDRFYRAGKDSHRPAGEGTGLGLSIAKTVVELHGGQIQAQSREGEGTEIKFTIPV